MENIQFSIVIPLYNKGKYIERTLRSIDAQIYLHYEIVIIDDGSTDNSVEIARKAMNDKLSIIHQANKGVSAARNHGIERAKCEWIVFLDADDEIKPNYLFTLHQMINEYPDHRVFTTGYEFYSEISGIKMPHFVGVPPNEHFGIIENFFLSSLKGNSILTCSSTCVHKNIFDKTDMFPTSYKRGEDLDLWFRIALNHKIVFYNKSLVIYHKDDEDAATSHLDDVRSIFPYHHWFRAPRNKFDLHYQNRYIINRIAKAIYTMSIHGKLHHIFRYFIR